jgi:hypothetical protein
VPSALQRIFFEKLNVACRLDEKGGPWPYCPPFLKGETSLEKKLRQTKGGFRRATG